MRAKVGMRAKTTPVNWLVHSYFQLTIPAFYSFITAMRLTVIKPNLDDTFACQMFVDINALQIFKQVW